MKILITGFGPFGDHLLNPSQKLVHEIHPSTDEKLILDRLILPVDHVSAPQLLLQHLHHFQPDGVISFGLAAGRAKISLERLAVNLKDFRHADNQGVKISNESVTENGPAAYFSTLPLLCIFDTLKQSNIPVELSLSAGAFLCNQIFYTLMHEIAMHQLPIRAGFIHLPALPEEAAVSEKPIPSMSIEQLIKAGEIIIRVLKRTLESNQ